MSVTVFPPATSGGAAMTQKTVRITSTTSWTAPTGVTSVEVILCGGGGGGQGGSSLANWGGGGGGGSVTYSVLTVVPATSYTITIGAGGAGGSGSGGAYGSGSTGGTSSFGALLSIAGGGPGGNNTSISWMSLKSSVW